MPRKVIKRPSTTSFRLMDLPVELVLRVVKLAVTLEGPIVVRSAIDVARRHRTRSRSEQSLKEHYERLMQPSITRTCGLLRYEGLRMFYGKNTFTAETFPEPGIKLLQENAQPLQHLLAWLRCLSQDQANAIGPVPVSRYISRDFWQCEAFPWTMRRTCFRAAMDLLEDFRGFCGELYEAGIKPYIRVESGKIGLQGTISERPWESKVTYVLSFQAGGGGDVWDTECWRPLEDTFGMARQSRNTGQKIWILKA